MAKGATVRHIHSTQAGQKSLEIQIKSRLNPWFAVTAIAFIAHVTDCSRCIAGEVPKAVSERFERHCFDCHSNGSAEGGFDFGKLASGEYGTDTQSKWETVWKNIRAQTMPPAEAELPSADARKEWIHWIQQEIFRLDPNKIDPGQIVLRRLNRNEYKETIKTLTGVEFQVEEEFPADDTGYGFDTIGESLTLSPVLLEKYLAAASAIVSKFAPLEYREPARNILFNGPPPTSSDSQQSTSPEFAASVRSHMKAVVRRFADQAFRRPIDEHALDRLCDIGMRIAGEPGKRYEHGVAAAMQLVLASPRFLYRIDLPHPSAAKGERVDSELAVRIDDYALASRLSYLLWGGPPDDELMRVAASGKLHETLLKQFDRMTQQHLRLQRGIENFVGQWLRTRDVRESQVDVKEVLRIRNDEEANRIFTWQIRDAMARETYQLYQHLLKDNRPAEELLNARYTFVNEPLAKFYGIDGVQGDEMRKVDLPPSSHRRGVLSHGSVLLVTSNPTRTSPVKRGLFILDNLLGTPAPPAPPNIPALEDSKSGTLKNASLRQVLEFHRRDAGCAACHQRMDPLGLAMENFNALGQWREMEKGRSAFGKRPEIPDQPIDPSGKLMTGEAFASVDELAGILAENRKEDFYRCLTEKILTFALGRGMTYRDSTAIDLVVEQVKKENGSMRTLYGSIITSVPFTHCRTQDADDFAASK